MSHEKSVESPRVGAQSNTNILFSWTSGPLQIELHDGRLGVPEGVLELRRSVYVEECQIMREENLSSPNDELGIHILARDLTTGELLGASHMVEAELSDFADLAGIPRAKLTNSFYGSRSALRPDRRGSSIYPLLMYAGSSFYRSKGRKNAVAFVESGDHPVQRRFRMRPIANAKAVNLDLMGDKSLLIEARWLPVDVAQAISFSSLMGDHAKEIARKIAVTEIELVVEGWSRECNHKFTFWKKAREGTLTQNQYIDLLGQLHRFVRNTTRVIALAWNRSQTKDLQKHFRKHVNEEIDHEVIIEADLAYLGADLNYVLHQMPSEPGIRAFNALQESLLSYHSDPVMYMAVPFAVEGISAFISDENIHALSQCINKWGIKDPRQATRFLASHRDFDGDQGGHWDGTLVMLRKYIKDETQGREFLAISRSVFDNFTAMMEGVAASEDPDHWVNTQTPEVAAAAQEPSVERVSSMTL